MSPPEVKRVLGHEELPKPAKTTLSWDEYTTLQADLKSKSDALNQLRDKYSQVYGSYIYKQYERCQQLLAQAYDALARNDYSKAKELLEEATIPDADEIYRYFSLKSATLELFKKEDIARAAFEKASQDGSIPDGSFYKAWAKLGKIYLTVVSCQRNNKKDEVSFLEESLEKILRENEALLKDSTIEKLVCLIRAQIAVLKEDYTMALSYAEKVIDSYGDTPKEFIARAKLIKLYSQDKTGKIGTKETLRWYEVYAKDKALGTVSYDAAILLSQKQIDLKMYPWAVVNMDRLIERLTTVGDGNSELYKIALELLASTAMKYAGKLGFKDLDGNEIISGRDEEYDNEVDDIVTDVNNDDHINKEELILYAYKAIKGPQKIQFYKEEFLTAVRSSTKPQDSQLAVGEGGHKAPVADDTAIQESHSIYVDAVRLATGEPVVLASASDRLPPLVLADKEIAPDKAKPAVKKLEWAVEKYPLNVEALMALGIISRSQGEYFKAIEYFKLAQQAAKIHLLELGADTGSANYEYYSSLYGQAVSFLQYTDQAIKDNIAPETLTYVANGDVAPLGMYSPYIADGLFFRSGDAVSTEVRGYMGAGFYLDKAQQHSLQGNIIGGTDMFGFNAGYGYRITPHTALTLGFGTFWEGYTGSNFFTRGEIGLTHRFISDNHFVNGLTLHAGLSKEWTEVKSPLLFTPRLSFVYPTGLDSNFGGEDGESGDHMFGGSLGIATDFQSFDPTKFFNAELYFQGHKRLGRKVNFTYDASTAVLRPYNLDLGLESSGNGFLIGGGLKFNPNTIALGAVNPWLAVGSLPYLSLGYRAQDGDAYKVKLQLGTIGIEKSAFHFGTQLWQVDIVYFPIFFPYITTRMMPGERGVQDDWKAWSAYPHLKKPDLARATNELDERFTFRFVGESGQGTEKYAHVYSIVKYDSEGNIILGKRVITITNGQVTHQDYVKQDKSEIEADFSGATSQDLLTSQKLRYKEAALKYYKARTVEHLREKDYKGAIRALAMLSVINPDKEILAFIESIAAEMEKQLVGEPIKFSEKAEKLAELYESIYQELHKAGKGYTVVAIKSKQYANQAQIYRIKFLRQEGEGVEADALERKLFASLGTDLGLGFDISQLLPSQGTTQPFRIGTSTHALTAASGGFSTKTFALSSSSERDGKEDNPGQGEGNQGLQHQEEVHGYDTAFIDPARDAYRTTGELYYVNGVLVRKGQQRTSKITARHDNTVTYTESKPVTDSANTDSFESQETIDEVDDLIDEIIAHDTIHDPEIADDHTELEAKVKEVILKVKKDIPAKLLVRLKAYTTLGPGGEPEVRNAKLDPEHRKIALKLYKALLERASGKTKELYDNLYLLYVIPSVRAKKGKTLEDIFGYLEGLLIPPHPYDVEFLEELYIEIRLREPSKKEAVRKRLKALRDKFSKGIPVKPDEGAKTSVDFSLSRSKVYTFYDHRYVPKEYRGLLDWKALRFSLPLTTWLKLRETAEFGDIQDMVNLGLDLDLDLGKGFQLQLGGDVDLYHKRKLMPYLMSYGYTNVGDAMYGDIQDRPIGLGHEEDLENHQYLRLGWKGTTEGGYTHSLLLGGEHNDDQFRRHVKGLFGYKFTDPRGSGLSLGYNFNGYNPGLSNAIYAHNYYFMYTHALTKGLFLNNWVSQQFLSNLDTSLAGHELRDQFGNYISPGGLTTNFGTGLSHKTDYAETKVDLAMQILRKEDLPNITGDYDAMFALSINNKVKIGDERVTVWDYFPLIGMIVRMTREPKEEYQEQTTQDLIAKARRLIDNYSVPNGEKAIEILEAVLWRDDKNIIAYQLLEKVYWSLGKEMPAKYKKIKFTMDLVKELHISTAIARITQLARSLAEKTKYADEMAKKLQAKKIALQADPSSEQLKREIQDAQETLDIAVRDKNEAAKILEKEAKAIMKLLPKDKLLEKESKHIKALFQKMKSLSQESIALAEKAKSAITANLESLYLEINAFVDKTKTEQIRIIKGVFTKLDPKKEDEEKDLYLDLYIQLINQSITILERILEQSSTYGFTYEMKDLIDVIAKSYGKSISSYSKEEIERVILFLKQKRESALAIKLGISPETVKDSDEYTLLMSRPRKKK